MGKIGKNIITAVLTTIFILSFIVNWRYPSICTKTLFIFAALIYSCILIPFTFHNVLSSPRLKMNGYYHLLHIFYVVLPIGLIGQVMLIDQIWCMVFITQAISMGNLFILYRCCKHLIKNHLEYLRYSNMLITGVFSFLIPLLLLYKDYRMNKDSEMYKDFQMYKDSLNVVFTFLFLLPFFGLRVLYKRIGLSVEDEVGTPSAWYSKPLVSHVA